MAVINKKVKASLILATLRELYPDAKSELNFDNRYQLLVAVILSAQCTDKKVNQVTPELFQIFPDFKALGKGEIEVVEKIIRPINYYRTKSKNLIAMAEKVVSEHNGSLPTTRVALESLPGVGRKTTNVVLSELNIEPAIAVDTHVFRLAHRLGLSKGKNPVEVEKDLQKAFPSSDWRMLHHGLILHGRRVCKAQSPNCAECTLVDLCPGRQLKD